MFIFIFPHLNNDILFTHFTLLSLHDPPLHMLINSYMPLYSLCTALLNLFNVPFNVNPRFYNKPIYQQLGLVLIHSDKKKESLKLSWKVTISLTIQWQQLLWYP